MRSSASFAATAAVLFAIGLNDATPVLAVPAAVNPRSPSPSPAQAAPITLPIHRRAGHAKRNKESFLRAVAHMKAKYGGSTTSSERRGKRSTGTLSMTNYQDSEFYATVSVGTPAVDYNMVLDTGSSDMILAVDSCNGCSSSTPGYSSSSSSTSVSSSETFSITYGSGSASGTLVEDTVSIAGYSMANQVFAACDTMNNIVDGDISGILGMGWSTIASSQAVPLVEGLAQNGTLPSQVFGFAFKSYAYDKLTSETMAGGTLTIGSTDTSAYTGDINWIPIGNPGYWTIPIDGMTASGSDITLTTTDIIVDSGTTLIGMPAADVDAIYAQISAASAYSLDGQSGYYSFPCDTNINVTMTFGGVSYAIPSDSFNAGAVDTSGSTCLGAIFALETSGTVQAILGDAFLTGVYSAFRFDDTPAVGFAELGSGGTAVAGSSSEASKSNGSTSPASGMSSLLSKSSVGVAVLASVAGVLPW